MRNETLAPSSVRAYHIATEQFLAWCQKIDTAPMDLTARQLADYLSRMQKGRATVRVHRAAIRRYYLEHGNPLPITQHIAVQHAMEQFPRPRRRTASLPLTRPMVLRLIRECGYGRKGLRDRALFACAFALQSKFAPILALRVADLDAEHQAVRLKKRHRSLPDDGALKPWHLIFDWLKSANISGGVIFQSIDKWGNLSGHAMRPADARNLFIDYCSRIGVDPRRFNAASFTKN